MSITGKQHETSRGGKLLQRGADKHTDEQLRRDKLRGTRKILKSERKGLQNKNKVTTE